jgi:hypothetical protein
VSALQGRLDIDEGRLRQQQLDPGPPPEMVGAQAGVTVCYTNGTRARPGEGPGACGTQERAMLNHEALFGSSSAEQAVLRSASRCA